MANKKTNTWHDKHASLQVTGHTTARLRGRSVNGSSSHVFLLLLLFLIFPLDNKMPTIIGIPLPPSHHLLLIQDYSKSTGTTESSMVSTVSLIWTPSLQWTAPEYIIYIYYTFSVRQCNPLFFQKQPLPHTCPFLCANHNSVCVVWCARNLYNVMTI